MKRLKTGDKGNKPNAADALEPTDIECMWSSGALGDTDPLILQQTLWWLIATHMHLNKRETSSRCPVRLYRAFVQSRPPEMCTPDSPFYLAVNHQHTSASYWYKKQPLGVTLLNRIMES